MASKLLPFSGYCEASCNEHGHTSISSIQHSFGNVAKVVFLNVIVNNILYTHTCARLDLRSTYFLNFHLIIPFHS